MNRGDAPQGSVANLVLRRARVPVLVVRPRAVPQEVAAPAEARETPLSDELARLEFNMPDMLLLERSCEQPLAQTGQDQTVRQIETVLSRLRAAKAGAQ